MTITLKTLPEATAQEIFDQVARHLLTQEQRSLDDGKCCYHSKEGLKCAAGCLIGEEEYALKMEGKMWGRLVIDELVPATHKYLISQLQSIHDTYSVENWKSTLILLAKRNRLTFPADL